MGSLCLVFLLFLLKNKPQTFQKLCKMRDHAELSHGQIFMAMLIQSTENGSDIQMLCTESYQLNLEAMYE